MGVKHKSVKECQAGTERNKQSRDHMEVKVVGGRIVETKIENRNGIDVGIVEGYISTWDMDRGGWDGIKDQFIKGAFLESLQDHRNRGNRQVRLKDHHDRTVGGFPINSVREDERGLFGIGEINLEVQQGKEVFLLAKQGVLTDFSIGFSVEESETNDSGAIETRIRTISKATLWEGSIVDEPMNPHANITDVKSWGIRDIEKALKEGSKLSDSAAKKVIQIIKGCPDSQFVDEELLKFFIMFTNEGENAILESDSINLEIVAAVLSTSGLHEDEDEELDMKGVHDLVQRMQHIKLEQDSKTSSQNNNGEEYTKDNFDHLLLDIGNLTKIISISNRKN